MKDMRFRDDKGRINAIKIQIRIKQHMSKDGFSNGGRLQRRHISKSKFVWRPYVSSRDWFYKFFSEGRIPVEHFMTNRAILDFIFDYILVDDNTVLAIQAWQRRRGCRKGIGFTSHLCEIKIINFEKRIGTVYKIKRLDYYWFRKEAKKMRKNMWR